MQNFSSLYHQSSKDNAKGHPPIAVDPNEWPIEWETVSYKQYPRLPKVSLPSHQLPQKNLEKLILQRSSERDFQRRAISLEALSSLLKYSVGIVGENEKRAHPSAGARFPLEVYVLSLAPSHLPTGVYHYNPKEHLLDVLWERPFSDDDIQQLFSYKWVMNASFVVILTAVFQRNQMKYGERGYRYILLEAGHASQNFYLVSTALSLKCCAIVGTRDQVVESLLDIDGVTESVVYALAFG